jgi:DNA-3-methyladenine glycosylase
VNVVTEGDGSPAAVLIRALEPIDGVATMKRRRGRSMKGRRRVPATIADADVCRGPGNLTMAMGITLEENMLDLTGDRLFVDDRRLRLGEIEWTPRIGISVGTDRPWRASIVGHGSVSGAKAPHYSGRGRAGL